MGHTFMIEEGDWVQDPTDSTWRKVTGINGNTLHLEDGGVMGKDEVADVALPGEIEGLN